MKKRTIAGLLALLAFTAAGCSSIGEKSVALSRVQGYYVGGSTVTLSNLPIQEIQAIAGGPKRKSDPNGDYQVGQLYVQKFSLVSPQARFPLMFWHGGGLTGVTWEDTPDGRPGWHEFFMGHGHDTLVSDAVERGRASWARYPEINPGPPEHRPINQAWEMFRFGPDGGYSSDKTQRKAYPNQQFPTDAAEQFEKQFVARWTTSNVWTQKAYDALVQKECPCVILAHSQGGPFVFQAALNAPDKIKAVIVIEPAGAPDLAKLTKDELARLKQVPHVQILGDHIKYSPLWQKYRANVGKYLEALKDSGVKVDTIDLPSRGIFGNSHMIMMDKNSDQVAQIVQDWIRENGLMK